MFFYTVRNWIKAVYFAICAGCFVYGLYQIGTGKVAALWIAGLGVAYVIRMLGVTCGNHRLATHRSFKTWPWCQFVLLVWAAFAVQHVCKWVFYHQLHHALSDKCGDPHSPHDGTARVPGWWHAQIFWFWSPAQFSELKEQVERVQRLRESDAVMGFVDKTYPIWALLPFVASFVIGGLAGGLNWHDFWVGGVHMVIWTNFICLFLTYMMTGLINSSGHMHPEKRGRTHDYSQNFGGKFWPIVALLTAGESFHGNHHDSQRMANLGRTSLQIWFDPGTHLIWLLEKLGIAWDVNWSWKVNKATIST